jgi:hypothetical protein
LLAIWIVMKVVYLPARRMYWEKSLAYSCAMFKEWGSWRYFKEFLSVINLPVYGPDDDRYVQGSGGYGVV